jgi:glycogen operon protein
LLIAHRLRGLEIARETLPESFELSLNELLRRAEIDWHGVRLGQPDWSDDSHSLACTVRPGRRYFPFWLHMIFNAYWEPLDFDLPAVPATGVSGWQRWIDTALESPEDIVDVDAAPLVPGRSYRIMPRSVAVLFLRIAPPRGVPA